MDSDEASAIAAAVAGVSLKQGAPAPRYVEPQDPEVEREICAVLETQIREGKGETIVTLGAVGLSDADLANSLSNLNRLARTHLDADVTVLQTRSAGPPGCSASDCLVRRRASDDDFRDVRVGGAAASLGVCLLKSLLIIFMYAGGSGGKRRRRQEHHARGADTQCA
jgi:GTPase